MCPRCVGESLSHLSARIGLSHPISSSNVIRRAAKRMPESESIHLLIARRVADLSDSTFSLFPVKSNGLEHFLSMVAGVAGLRVMMAIA